MQTALDKSIDGGIVKGFNPDYIAGNIISLNSGTPLSQLDVSIGSSRDDTDVLNLITTGVLTIDFTTTGINALDTGVVTVDTFYALFIIGDTTGINTPKTLASLSATTPTLPSGYNVKRRIGWWLTGFGSSNLVPMTQFGKYNIREYVYAVANSDTRVLSNGNATSFTVVDCSAFIPSTSTKGFFNWGFSDAVAGNSARVKVSGSSGNSPYRILPGTGINSTANAMRIPGIMYLNSSQELEYNVDASGDDFSVRIVGFTDEV